MIINKERINMSNQEDRTSAQNLKRIKKGDFASFYTCLYISNMCINDCPYCGYQRGNSSINRITLKPEEIRAEAIAIKKSGVSNAIIIGGSQASKKEFRLMMLGVEIAASEGVTPWVEADNLTLEELCELRKLGSNHFVLFQETYDRKAYESIHKNCPSKKSYDNRLMQVELAVEAGFKNIGIGALFGLTHDYLFEALALYHHAKHLQSKGVDVCISCPTIKAAPGVNLEEWHVPKDEELQGIYTALRLALPSASLALSSRESINLRNILFSIVDQIGTGGAPNPGGRSTHRLEYQSGETQFQLQDTRSPAEIRKVLNTKGITVVDKLSWGMN